MEPGGKPRKDAAFRRAVAALPWRQARPGNARGQDLGRGPRLVTEFVVGAV